MNSVAEGHLQTGHLPFFFRNTALRALTVGVGGGSLTVTLTGADVLGFNALFPANTATT
jgi:hypothetical protein